MSYMEEHITKIMTKSLHNGFAFYACCDCGWKSNLAANSGIANKYREEHVNRLVRSKSCQVIIL